MSLFCRVIFTFSFFGCKLLLQQLLPAAVTAKETPIASSTLGPTENPFWIGAPQDGLVKFDSIRLRRKVNFFSKPCVSSYQAGGDRLRPTKPTDWRHRAVLFLSWLEQNLIF